MDFRKYMKENIVIFDGAMGTMLQQNGLQTGEIPEILNITHSEIVEKIHRMYIQSGSRVITTNTFGANELKLTGCGYSQRQIIQKAMEIAKSAATDYPYKIYIAQDIGPIGELLEPLGTLSFERAYEIYANQVFMGEEYGADLFLLETMTDLYEMKAAILAVKENSSLPLVCTMSFEENRRTFTGCEISSMAVTLQALGVDAIGINCSLGPAEIFPLVEELIKWTDLPILVQPNAGLPNLEQDGLHYSVSAKEFALWAHKYMDLGVSLFGGCCGTTPEYIEQAARLAKEYKPEKRPEISFSAVCSPAKTVCIDQVRVIGERINPTGKKLLKEALRNGNMDYILQQGLSQQAAGAAILDVNTGLPEIDESAVMRQVVKQLQAVLDCPLQIDSSDVKAIEAGLRAYNGKCIVNSVNGEDAVLDTVLPLIKKYGAAVVGLTLDNNGIPLKAEQRLAIARHICEKAESYGIPRRDIFIDCLVLTASAQQKEVMETIKAVHLVKEQLGVKTVLGVSNISFGLPNRELINQTFLTMALTAGLDMPILNPNVPAMMDTIRAFHVLSFQDINSKEYIAYQNTLAQPAKKPTEIPQTAVNDIDYAIAKGLKKQTEEITRQLLQEHDCLDIVNEHLIPALDKVGDDFEKGIVFLPQLIQAAEAAKAAFTVIKEAMSGRGESDIHKGKIIVATVKGDIHDIGKNIVKVVLENYGYEVIDLGRDVPVETVVEQAEKLQVPLVGLSALMTTTLKSMEQTITALHQANIPCKTFVGGAVLTEDYAKKIGADFYAKDAKEAVTIAKKVLG